MLQENEVRKVDIYKWSEHMTSITSSNRETLAHGTLPRESRHNQTEILATLDFTTSADGGCEAPLGYVSEDAS